MKLKCFFRRLGGIAFAAMAGGVSMLQSQPACAAAETAPKLIALTFDDGPNTTTTNDVLDVLERYGAVGSFFLIGDNINAESAESVRRAYTMGCEIDNHSKSHGTMSSMTEAEISAEIRYVDEAVMNIIGEYPRFFRPPFIATSQLMYDVIDLPFICGLDCKDFMADVTAEQRADTILTHAKDGLIVLLHDAAGNDQTVAALEMVIPTLQAEGYEFVTLTELFTRQGETPKGNLIYSEVAKYPCEDYVLYQNLFTGEAQGDSSWSGWSETAVLDGATLASLGDTYAIEVAYQSTDAPVIALQKWSGNPTVWTTVSPAYYNGERACFLAKDMIAALEDAGVTYTELDRMSVVPYGATMVMTRADLLVQQSTGSIAGDVNADGACTIADAVAMQRFLTQDNIVLRDWRAGDLYADDVLNALDFTLLKRILLHAMA